MPMRLILVVTSLLLVSGLQAQSLRGGGVGDLPTIVRAADNRFISWREHLVDDQATSGVELRGSDGLEMADLYNDGYMDIVSVHESDDVYDGAPEGHIRIAFGTADPDRWINVTLAEGPEAGAAEDVAIGDVNGDGFPDIIAACELSHLIYFQNPGRNIRAAGNWERVRPTSTLNRGSFIRVFLADLDGDGRLEAISPNKGAQDPTKARQEPREISVFRIPANPLDAEGWTEHVLTRVPWPINAEPVDLDGDGDMDIVAGSVAQTRMMWFENRSTAETFDFVQHDIMTGGYSLGSRLEDYVAKPANALGRLAWWENAGNADGSFIRHDISRRERGMFDMFMAQDMDNDGDIDFVGTRGNSGAYDGVFWLEQVRAEYQDTRFIRARASESPEFPAPEDL